MWLEYLRPAEFKQRIIESDPRLVYAIDTAGASARLPSLGTYQLSAIKSFGEAVETRVTLYIGQERTVTACQLDIASIGTLARVLSGPGGKVIFMRHGGQALDEETSKLQGTAQKIALMRPKHNRYDLVTDESIAETAGLTFTLAHLGQKTGKRFVIVTSPNYRAASVAVVLSETLNAPFAVNDTLACTEYPDDKSDAEIEEILGPDSNGTAKMEKGIIDALEGEGTYERRLNNIAQIRDEALAKDGIVTVVMGHSQDLEGIQKRTPWLGSPIRLAELGMLEEDAASIIRLANGVHLRTAA